jgi:hypothetical protein
MPENENRTPDDSKKETIFYYSRERRLSNASPEVRAMNDGIPRLSLGKVMFGNRANKLLIIAIVLISVFGLAINFFNQERPPDFAMILGRNSLTLAVINVEDVLILAIFKNAPVRGEFYTGEVDIAVSTVQPRVSDGESQAEPEVFSHRILFRPLTSETFHISIPFEGDDFMVVLRAGGDQRSIRLRAVDAD